MVPKNNIQRTELAAHDLEIADRRRHVARMITARVPHRQIAKTLGVSASTVHADKTAIMREWSDSAIAHVHEIFLADLHALDECQQALYGRAVSGDDDAAVQLLLKILRQRAALLGYEADQRGKSGMRIEPPELVEDAALEPLLSPDGRPVGKGDAARIYAAFATPRPDAPAREAQDVARLIADANAV